MSIKLKFTLLGFILGVVAPVGVIMIFLLSGPTNPTMTAHDTRLPSGKSVKVVMCALVWGVGHTQSERNANLDQFQLEFVSANPGADSSAKDQEVLEAFELIRPISENWGLPSATVNVFPTTKRSGHYGVYEFQRKDDGSWRFERHDAKVHIND